MEDGVCVDDEKATSSFWQSAFNGINLLCGVGVLSLPYAFKQSGWAVGLALLLFICAITNYTGRLIGKCMALDPRIHTYSDIGAFAFGNNGRGGSHATCANATFSHLFSAFGRLGTRKHLALAASFVYVTHRSPPLSRAFVSVLRIR